MATTPQKNVALPIALMMLFGSLVALVFRLHIRYPLYLLTFYTVLLIWPAIENGQFGVALVLSIPTMLAWRFLREPLARFQYRRNYRNWIISVMEETLWKEVKAKQFVKVSRTDMAGVMRVELSTPNGQDDDAVLKQLPKFRSALRLADTIVLADENPYDGVVSVLFCQVSPLETVLDGASAPVLHLSEAEKRNAFQWLPIGVDANGSPYEVPLFLEEGGSVRQLCAGMSGSGKSSIVRQQLLQAALNPNIDVAIFDGKGSEFGLFEPYVQSFGRDTKDFWNQLRFLEAEVTRRGQVLNENKLTQTDRVSQSWNPTDDGNYLLWVWDEIGATMAGFDTKDRHEAMTKIYGILSVARSLGIGAILSSQTFKSDLLTTQIRDNCFDISLGFKMNSAQEASYIGFDPADEVTPANIKGKILKSGRSATVGTFAMKGIDRNAYGRSYFISDKQIKAALAAVPSSVPSTTSDAALASVSLSKKEEI